MRKITFACLNAGNYCGRGAQYVNTLFDMVERNLPAGTLFRFVCLTDDPAGLHERIETLPLPADLTGWWGKLYFFKRGLFADGERVIFLDLDTVIVGKIDQLVAYDGQFATLEDFFFPEQLGPAVIAWEAGEYAASIWEEWVACGKPRDGHGDLWWINQLDQGRFAKRSDKLQVLFPGMFCSYKRSCAPIPPKGTRVVCFHGTPRPHEAVDDWVHAVWSIGGGVIADLEVVANTSREQVAKNIRSACTLNHPWLEMEPPHAGEVAIVGGGPSLKDMLPELRQRAQAGVQVVAVNGAHDYLVQRGIEPDVHVIIDARPENAKFITKPAKSYVLASQCAPETFARAAGRDVTIAHMNTERVLESIPQGLKPVNLISSGSTVALAAIAIGYVRGFRKFYLYGMDSSYEDTRHAYPQSLNDQDRVIEAQAGGRKFKCAPWMLAQVEHFQILAAELANDGCELHVRCYGLLGHVAWLWANLPQERAKAA
jgi:hypothetical protein